MSLIAEQTAVRRQTGGYINQSPLSSIAGVMPAFDELISRVQALPFVPSSWSDDVRKAMSAAGDRLWLPAPVIRVDAWRAGKTEPVYPDTPPWLANNEDARIAWNTLVDWWGERLQPILAGWARDQQAILTSATNDAKFWSALYEIVRPVAAVGDAIIAAPGAAAEVITKAAGGALKGFLPLILVVGLAAVGLVVFKTKMVSK